MKLILPEKGGGGDLNRKILMGRPQARRRHMTPRPDDDDEADEASVIAVVPTDVRVIRMDYGR